MEMLVCLDVDQVVSDDLAVVRVVSFVRNHVSVDGSDECFDEAEVGIRWRRNQLHVVDHACTACALNQVPSVAQNDVQGRGGPGSRLVRFETVCDRACRPHSERLEKFRVERADVNDECSFGGRSAVLRDEGVSQ